MYSFDALPFGFRKNTVISIRFTLMRRLITVLVGSLVVLTGFIGLTSAYKKFTGFTISSNKAYSYMVIIFNDISSITSDLFCTAVCN